MKTSLEDYLVKLLEDAGCKHIVRHSDSITSECPFHHNKFNFKTFRVSTVEKTWKSKEGVSVTGYFYNCFSCHESGSVYKLLAYLSGCSLAKAIKLLNKNILIPKVSMDDIKKQLAQLKTLSSEQSVMFEESMMPLKSHKDKPMYDYLKTRRKMYHNILDIDYIVAKYGLYYCSSGNCSGRIIMPIYDNNGILAGYNDRTILDGVKNQSMHVKNMQYGRLLHGIYENGMKKYGILCEGAFDMFSVDCYLRKRKLNKMYGAVSMMGTCFTRQRFDLMSKSFDRIVLMADNDTAGKEAINKILKDYNDEECFFNMTEHYPEGKDPGSCTMEEFDMVFEKFKIKKNNDKTMLGGIIKKLNI